MRTGSLATRLVLSAGAWCAVLLVVAGVALAAVFQRTVERGFDAHLNVLLDSLIAATEFRPGRGVTLTRRLTDPRFQRAFSGWYWQIAAPDGTLVRSRSLWDEALPWPAALAGEPPVPAPVAFAGPGPDDEAIRGLARPVRLPGEPRPFRFLVAGATAEMIAEHARFNRILVAALGGLGIGLLLSLVVQVRFGLSPLRALSRALAAIRTGEHRRLEGEFPAEIRPLADELNALLAQNAEVVERARTQVGNLAHALKTPLSVLRNSAGKLPGEQAAALTRQLQAMERHVGHYLARAQAAGPVGLGLGSTPVREVVEDLARTLEKLYPESGIRLHVEGAAGLRFAGDRQDLEEILGNVLDNAFKWARGAVSVRIGTGGSGAAGPPGRWLEVRIEDDGPGLDPALRDAVLERGRRLDETRPGAGLGLDIVRDFTTLYGGTMQLDAAPAGGLGVTLTLPRAT